MEAQSAQTTDVRATHRPIASKREMYPLYEAGLFGNKLRTWASPDDLNGYHGTLSLRYAGAAGGGFVAYEVPRDEVAQTIEDWQARGADPSLVRLNESAPDERLVAQGEIARFGYGRGLVVTYSTDKTKMRTAMKSAIAVTGLRAKLTLERFLSPSSQADIDALLDLYPEHVVEFSAYAMNLGAIPGRNAVIWEVRAY